MVKLPTSRRTPPGALRQRGFTLIEMVIVMAIIAILISVAIPIYSQSIQRARETVLKQNLYSIRRSIDQYTMDKTRAPQSLDDVVSAGYLRSIPVDPITNSSETWVVEQEDIIQAVDQTQPGITDVHSGAGGTASDGTAYASW